MPLLLAAETVDPSVLERLGTAGIVAVVMAAAIVWLVRQLAAERAANRELSDRLVSTIERTVPVLERATRALERQERER